VTFAATLVNKLLTKASARGGGAYGGSVSFYASSFLFWPCRHGRDRGITQSRLAARRPSGCARSLSTTSIPVSASTPSIGRWPLPPERCDGSIGVRDHHTDEVCPINPQLLDLLTEMQQKLRSRMRFRSSPAIVPPQPTHAGDDDRRCRPEQPAHAWMAVDIRVPDARWSRCSGRAQPRSRRVVSIPSDSSISMSAASGAGSRRAG